MLDPSKVTFNNTNKDLTCWDKRNLVIMGTFDLGFQPAT